MRPLLQARGYDAAEFATVQQVTAIVAARDEYARFREIARASFPGQPDRLALSLTGDAPEDTGRFITLARASYPASGKASHAAKFTKRGYPAATLAPLIAGLDALTDKASEQDEAQGAAIGNAAERDAAYDALRALMKELKGVAKGALRGNPSLLAKFGL